MVSIISPITYANSYANILMKIPMNSQSLKKSPQKSSSKISIKMLESHQKSSLKSLLKSPLKAPSDLLQAIDDHGTRHRGISLQRGALRCQGGQPGDADSDGATWPHLPHLPHQPCWPLVGLAASPRCRAPAKPYRETCRIM